MSSASGTGAVRVPPYVPDTDFPQRPVSAIAARDAKSGAEATAVWAERGLDGIDHSWAERPVRVDGTLKARMTTLRVTG